MQSGQSLLSTWRNFASLAIEMRPAKSLIRPRECWCRCPEVCFWIAAKLFLKISIFLKNRHFIIQERFINKLIYSTKTIIKCGTWQPVKFRLMYSSWFEMILFYRIFELLLPTLIQRYDNKIISILSQFKNERLTNILKAVRYHILWSY